MAAKLFLALVTVVGLMWYLGWYNKATPEQRNQSLRSVLLYGIGAAILILVLTGRIPWLFATISAAVPWLNRALAAKRVWKTFEELKNPGENRQQHPHSPCIQKTDHCALQARREALRLSIQAHRWEG